MSTQSLCCIALIVLTPLAQSCKKNENRTASAAYAQVPPSAKAFKTLVYRTLDNRSSITLISPEELELRAQDGAIYLCKYTKTAEGIRGVSTIFGTQQVLYFRAGDGGLIDGQGTQFFDVDSYNVKQKEIEVAKKSAEERQRKTNQLVAEATQAGHPILTATAFEMISNPGDPNVCESYELSDNYLKIKFTSGREASILVGSIRDMTPVMQQMDLQKPNNRTHYRFVPTILVSYNGGFGGERCWLPFPSVRDLHSFMNRLDQTASMWYREHRHLLTSLWDRLHYVYVR